MIEVIKRNSWAFIATALLVGGGVESLAKAADTDCSARCPGTAIQNAADPMLVVADDLEAVTGKFGVVGPDGRFNHASLSASKNRSPAGPRPIGTEGSPIAK